MNEGTPIDETVKLPCDVQVAHVIFRKGVSLETLRLAAERWFKIAREHDRGRPVPPHGSGP